MASLTLFRVAAAKRPPFPASFSFVTSLKVCITPKNFLNFSFDHVSTLLFNFSALPRSIAKLLNFNQSNSFKNLFFWPNPEKIEAIITSLTEML